MFWLHWTWLVCIVSKCMTTREKMTVRLSSAYEYNKALFNQLAHQFPLLGLMTNESLPPNGKRNGLNLAIKHISTLRIQHNARSCAVELLCMCQWQRVFFVHIKPYGARTINTVYIFEWIMPVYTAVLGGERQWGDKWSLVTWRHKYADDRRCRSW